MDRIWLQGLALFHQGHELGPSIGGAAGSEYPTSSNPFHLVNRVSHVLRGSASD